MFYSPNRTDLHTETAVHTFVYVCGMGFTVFQFINIRRALFNTLSTSSTLIVVYLYCSFLILKFFYHFITIYISLSILNTFSILPSQSLFLRILYIFLVYIFLLLQYHIRYISILPYFSSLLFRTFFMEKFIYSFSIYHI